MSANREIEQILTNSLTVCSGITQTEGNSVPLGRQHSFDDFCGYLIVALLLAASTLRNASGTLRATWPVRSRFRAGVGDRGGTSLQGDCARHFPSTWLSLGRMDPGKGLNRPIGSIGLS